MHRQKTRLFPGAAIVLALLVTHSVFADQSTEALMKLYKRKKDLDQRYDIMSEIVRKNDPSTAPFLIESLDDLNRAGVQRDSNKEEARKDLMLLAISGVGGLKAGDAAPVLYDTVADASDPTVKSEAIIALGDVGASAYAERIALILKDTNTYRGTDTSASETIAYGCIRALGALREPVGYLPVFNAYTSGYSRRIRDEAMKALSTMVDDPTPMLCEIVENEPSIRIKIAALEAGADSKAGEKNKTEVAKRGLSKGLSLQPLDKEEEGLLRELRVGALRTYIALGYPDSESIGLIEESIYASGEDDERLLAVEALKGMRNDEAAAALVRFLGYQNDRRESGVKERDNRVVVATIRALGASGSDAGYEELLRVKYSGYTPAVVREAEQALAMLKK